MGAGGSPGPGQQQAGITGNLSGGAVVYLIWLKSRIMILFWALSAKHHNNERCWDAESVKLWARVCVIHGQFPFSFLGCATILR